MIARIVSNLMTIFLGTAVVAVFVVGWYWRARLWRAWIAEQAGRTTERLELGTRAEERLQMFFGGTSPELKLCQRRYWQSVAAFLLIILLVGFVISLSRQ